MGQTFDRKGNTYSSGKKMSLGTHSFGYEKLRKHRVDLFCFLNHVWHEDIHICLKDKDSQPKTCALTPEWLGWLCVIIRIKNDQTIFISCSSPLFPRRSRTWNSKRSPQIVRACYSHLHPHLDAFYCFCSIPSIISICPVGCFFDLYAPRPVTFPCLAVWCMMLSW